jgi:hypothetical protein
MLKIKVSPALSMNSSKPKLKPLSTLMTKNSMQSSIVWGDLG